MSDIRNISKDFHSYHNTSQHSKPSFLYFADYPIRVDDTTIYEPQSYPRFTILTERLVINNNTLSTK